MRKGEEKKQEILAVAERLFCLKGYRETSVQDILDVLKTSKGSFYHHFESKEMVLSTLCAQRADRAAQEAKELLGGDVQGMALLNGLFHAMMPLRREECGFLAMLLPQLFTQEGKMVCYAYQEALRESFQPLLAQALKQASAENTVCTPGHEDVSGIVADLVNDCWLACAEVMLQQIRQMRLADGTALQGILNNYRSALERLLDAPWGSVEIIRLEEWLETAKQLERSISLA